MAILGSHTSAAGGLYRAVERAHAVGCDCVQLFTGNPRAYPKLEKVVQSGGLLTKNNNQWRTKELTDEDADKFQSALARLGIQCPIAHDSYLINLASPNQELWAKSVEAFRVELLRAEKLGIPYVVTHPGAFTDSSEQAGIERVIEVLDLVHRDTAGIKACTLLENTAGQGTCLGWRFEQLSAIIQGVQERDRLGVCLDTCHVFAAGYPLAAAHEYESTIAQLAKIVGLDRVKAIHVNDSKQPLGSRVDRHAHIGRGQLGLEPFRHLLNDPRFRHTPMYLETAKEEEGDEEMDVVNLRVLRGLIAA